MTTEIVVPELEQRALTLPEQACAIYITDQSSLDRAGELLRSVAALRQEITAHYKPLKEKAHAAHKAICEAEASMLAHPVRAEGILRPRVSAYLAEQERLRQEEERRLQAEEEERQRLASIAAAVEAEGQGASREEVDAIAYEEPVPVRVIAPPTVQAPRGIAPRETWSAEVTSLRDLAKAVAEGKITDAAILPNMVLLNNQARALKGELKIPGVRAVRTAGVAVNTKR
jgi:hypothetical protein